MPAKREQVAGLRETELREIVLDGRELDLAITGKVMSVAPMRTINGASIVTLTVLDRDHAVQRSGILDRAVDLKLPADDGTPLWFRLASDSSDDRGVLTLVFESRVWARIADKDEPRSMLRRKVTAAQFLLALVREVKAERIPFICRRLDVRQRIAETEKTEAKTPPAKKNRERSKGLASNARITVKGRPATSQQRRIIAGCLETADDLGASSFVMVAVVMCITQESVAGALVNATPDGDGADDSGIYRQGRPWVSLAGSKQPGPSTKAFLITGPSAWQKVHGTIRTQSGNLEQLLKRVQVSVGGYGQWEAEARRTVAAFGSGSLKDLDLPTEGDREPEIVDFRYRRGEDGKRETTTACGQRLAEERNWRFFESGGAIYFDSDETLIRSKPRMTITPESEGLVALPTHSRDVGHKVQEIALKYRVDGWGAPPGSVVVLDDWGAAKDGRWLVQDIGKDDVRSGTANVTLTRKRKAKLEPAPEERQRETETLGGLGSFGKIKQSVGTSERGVTGSPQEIINTIVIPFARKNGVNITVASNNAANGRHGQTVSGSRSDHQGPPDHAWAADMSNGQSPTPGMDALARDLARRFGIQWSGSGLVNHNVPGYRMQLIYRTNTGGNHFNHVHFGLKRT